MNEENGFSDAFISLPFLGELITGKHFDKAKRLSPKNGIKTPRINIPLYLKPSDKCFVVKMSGNSMNASGLLHHDWLIVESSSTAKNDAIVIATIDNLETVVKHFEQTNDLIILSSKSADIKPMIFDPSRIKIIGFLVAQMRRI